MTQALPWKRAVIVGASSGIGEALARRLARAGVRVALVARRVDALNALADSINGESGEALASVYPHDVVDAAAVPALFARIAQDLGGVDLMVQAAGIMPRFAAGEYDSARDIDTIQINVVGTVAWLNEAAQRFEKAGQGTLVGLSSVAGDRGRRGNTVYAATKAFVNVYLESLELRLSGKGVRVVNIKPGPIQTPMTTGMKLPFMISSDQAAEEILTAAKDGVRVAYVPAKWKPIMGLLRLIPAPLFRFLPI